MRKMKITALLLVALGMTFFAAAGFGRADVPETPVQEAGMFEWDETALQDPRSAVKLAQVLGITRWYQELPEKISRSKTESFVKAMSREGVAVYALVGATQWGFEADGASLIKAVKAVAAYNAKASKTGRLAGIMADVEPYTQERWKQAPEDSAQLYLSGMKAAYRYARKRGLVFVACIPRHYDDQGLGAMLEELVAKACDEVAVMNYDCGNEVKAIATEAALAAQYGKPLHCILEFQEVGKHGLTEEKTYYNKGLAAASKAWRAVEAAFPGQPVIRDYHWTQPVRVLLERDET